MKHGYANSKACSSLVLTMFLTVCPTMSFQPVKAGGVTSWNEHLAKFLLKLVSSDSSKFRMNTEIWTCVLAQINIAKTSLGCWRSGGRPLWDLVAWIVCLMLLHVIQVPWWKSSWGAALVACLHHGGFLRSLLACLLWTITASAF